MSEAAAPRSLGRSFKDALPPSIRVAKRALQSWIDGEPELRLLAQLCSPETWSVDIGANNGVYSWHMARLSAGVVAFEPQRDHADLLARAFGTRVRVERVALSDASGSAVLRVPTERHQDGRATIEAQNTLADHEVRSHEVPCRCLDSYGLPPVGLIKIDVEGHELAVLRGAKAILARDRPHLLVEAEDRHRPHAFRTLCAHLDTFGYHPMNFRAGQLSPAGPEAADAGGVNFVFLARPLP